MHTLKNIEIAPNYFLRCIFENDEVKELNLSSLKERPAFAFLENPKNFYSLKNKGYFIEWEGFDADLSADTLWHWDE